MDLDPEVFEKWHEIGIPAGQVYGFIEKGYTPKRALTRIKRGQTAATADDLRNGEPVPGKAWPEIKATIKNASASTGHTVTVTSKRASKTGDVIVTISMEEPPNSSSYISRKEYTVRFGNTGRFIAARGNNIYRGDVRKVDELKHYIMHR